MGRNGTATEGQKIINAVNNQISNEDVLGYQVYWTLYGGRVDTEEFKLAMQANGLSPDMLRPQTAKKKFIEVVNYVANKYSTDVKKIVERGGKLAFKIIKGIPFVEGLSDEELHNSKFQFEQDTTVIFDLNKGNPIVRGEGVQEIVDEVILGYESYLDKTSVEFIRLTFTDLLRKKAGAVSMRGSGGIYFIPVVKDSIIEGIKNLSVDFNLGTIYQLRLPAGSAEKQGIKDSAENELKQRLKYYTERVGNIKKGSTLDEKKLEAKAEVKDLFELYSDLLVESTKVDEREEEKASMFQEIREQYAELEVSITEKMVEIEKQN